MIARTALRDAVLRSVLDRPLTVIAAPPLSGKSTLVDQVGDELRSRGRVVSTSPEYPGEVTILRRIDRFGPADHARAVEVVEGCVGGGGRVLITTERPVMEAELALPRLRDQLREFGAAEMALKVEEIPAFLGDRFAENRVSRPIRLLLDRTEGWIAAWNVIRQLLDRGRSLPDLAEGFGGADPDIAGYFERLVMPACDEEVAGFLLQVGPLDRVCASLADTLTGRNDGLALIERARRQCAFVLADRESEWVRPHRLFRDYLRYRGARDDIRGLRRNLQKAARWRAERADWLGAARLYLDAGQPEASTEILERHTEELITGKGEVLPYRQLVASLSREADPTPALAAELALGSIFSGDFAGAAVLLEGLAPHIDSFPPAKRARVNSMWIHVDFGLERFDDVIAAAPRWLDQNRTLDPQLRATVAQSLFWSYFAQLDSIGSYRALAIARSETAKVASPFLRSWLCLAGSLHKWEHGQVSGADSLLAGAVGGGVIGHTLDLVRAAVALEQGHLARARQLIGESLHEGAKHSVVETSLLGWETAARIALCDTGLAGALAMLQDAETVMASRHGERARRLTRLARGKLLLQSPDEFRGADLGVEVGVISGEAAALGHCRSLGERAKLTLARFQALNGAPRQAISLLQPILVVALRQSRLRAWAEASMIYAGALARMEEPDRGARVAWHAAEQVSAGGVGATIWDEGVLLSPLLDDLMGRAMIASGTADAGAAAIVLALARCSGRSPSGPEPEVHHEAGVAARLTDMERRIIALVAQGLSNRDIAGRLLVRESTVKWHMHNVFGKLDVRSRTAALAEVRRTGLIG